MFGIGGGEMIFIIFIALMLFGSDKIPEIARTIAKTLAQLKHATDDIKSEITKSAEANGLDVNSLTGGVNKEIESVKQNFSKMMTDHTPENPINLKDVTSDITSEITSAKETLESLSGPIKRQL